MFPGKTLGGGCGLGMRPLGGGCGLGMKPPGGGRGLGMKLLAKVTYCNGFSMVHCRDQSTIGGGCLKMRSFVKVAYCNGFSIIAFISISLY